jgi:two-component system, cell cycle sensor histidine kinase and response regulator CckA
VTDVSGVNLRFFRETCERMGVRYEELIVGIPELERSPSPARFSWEAYVAIWDRIEALGARPEELGREALHDVVTRPLRTIAKGLTSSHAIYRAIFAWFGPSLYRNLVFSEERGDGSAIRLAIEIPEPYRPCRSFFQAAHGAFRAVPSLLGQPDAIVTADMSDRRVVYDIVPPPPLHAWARLRRTFRSMTAASSALRELSEQQRQLNDTYAALSRSNRDFQRAIDSVPDGVIIHRAGTVVFANPAWAQCLALRSTEEAIGARVADLLDPADRAAALSWMHGEGSNGEGPPRAFSFQRKDRETIVLELSPAQRVEFAGTPGWLVVARDVTEKKQLEQKLARADRLVALGTLAAGVAHEINNPLSYVILSLEAILEEAGDPNAIRGHAREALEGAERVRVIVKDLKNLSRTDDRAIGAVDPRAALEWSIGVANAELRARATLLRELGDVPKILGNESRLNQVFLNLLVNAAQSIPEGRADEHEIRAATRTDSEGWAVIEISDTGCGIPEESLGRIFDPFFTTKPVGTGTGLGLAICHSIIAEMRGDLEVASEVGVGSTFRVRLPPMREVEVLASAAPAAISRPARARVLIVDDDVHVGRSLRHVLSHHEVTLVHRGEEALDRMAREAFDVVLCDVMMPDMGGIEIYEALRERMRGEEKRMIFMTGGAFTARSRDFLARVPNACVEKPFARAAIDAAIATVLDARVGERARRDEA